jgi:hypothetical protein
VEQWQTWLEDQASKIDKWAVEQQETQQPSNIDRWTGERQESQQSSRAKCDYADQGESAGDAKPKQGEYKEPRYSRDTGYENKGFVGPKKDKYSWSNKKRSTAPKVEAPSQDHQNDGSQVVGTWAGWTNDQPKGKGSGVCFICQQPRHMAKSCWQRATLKQPVARVDKDVTPTAEQSHVGPTSVQTPQTEATWRVPSADVCVNEEVVSLAIRQIIGGVQKLCEELLKVESLVNARKRQ